MFREHWRYEEVHWGVTGCLYCIERPAVLLWDGEPMCAHCADDLLERQAAISQHPGLTFPTNLGEWSPGAF